MPKALGAHSREIPKRAETWHEWKPACSGQGIRVCMPPGYSPTNSWGSRFSASVASCRETETHKGRVGLLGHSHSLYQDTGLSWRLKGKCCCRQVTVSSASRLLGPQSSEHFSPITTAGSSMAPRRDQHGAMLLRTQTVTTSLPPV